MAIKYILIEMMTILACCLALAFLQFFFSGDFLSFEIANLLREDERYFSTFFKFNMLFLNIGILHQFLFYLN